MPRPVFPAPETWGDDDCIGWTDYVTADLMLDGYREGLFAMPTDFGWREPVIGWWSPWQRGVLDPQAIKVSPSLRQATRRYRVSENQAFDQVLAVCARSHRPGNWINPELEHAYLELHDRGFAVSIETWRGDQLVGGLFGLALGGLFVGESMFHQARDASKVALVHLAGRLQDGHPRLIDTQWLTPHLASLGAVEISRDRYLAELAARLVLPRISWGNVGELP